MFFCSRVNYFCVSMVGKFVSRDAVCVFFWKVEVCNWFDGSLLMEGGGQNYHVRSKPCFVLGCPARLVAFLMLIVSTKYICFCFVDNEYGLLFVCKKLSCVSKPSFF